MTTSTIVEASTPEAAGPTGPQTTVRRVHRAERRKLLAQRSTRLLGLVCVLGPLAFGGVLKLQTTVPADTLFGVWVHTSGFAVSLVVLGFSGMWGLPVVAGILAGDVFSSEDRHGTWKTVLTRSASRRALFAGKVLAVLELMVALTVCLAASSLIAGVVTAGAHPLVGLSGLTLSPAHSFALVVASWASTLPVVAGFACLAMLFSIKTRNGIAGAVAPVLISLAVQLLNLIGNGPWVHAILIGSAFFDWHGLFLAHVYWQPLLLGTVLSLAWAGGALVLAWRMLRRRDFAGPAADSRIGWGRTAGMALGALVVLGLLAGGTEIGPATITPGRLQSSLVPIFDRLTLDQQRLLGRTVPPGTHLRVVPECQQRGGTPGPGDDWTCTLEVFVPQAGVQPFLETPVTYDMSVQANGCYKADAPPPFIGQQLLRDARGHEVVNPLYTMYGCFRTLG